MAKAKPTKSVSSSKKPRMKKAASEPAPTIQGVPLVWIPSEPSQPPAVSSMCAKEREKNNTKEDNKGNQQEANNAQSTPPTSLTDRQNDMGDVALTVAESAAEYGLAALACEKAKQDAHRRWRNEGIAERVAAFRDRIRGEYVAAHPKCKRRDAQEYAWARALAEFPPPGVDPVIEPEVIEPIEDPEPEAAPAPIPSDQGVSGLGTMPESWGILPANASLQVEISWVSANRLRVRDGTGVDLSKALSPAPSYSALSWLETSILFPSKFADISVKATANQDDEREAIRREKLSIEEIRGLLSEMLEDGNP